MVRATYPVDDEAEVPPTPVPPTAVTPGLYFVHGVDPEPDVPSGAIVIDFDTMNVYKKD